MKNEIRLIDANLLTTNIAQIAKRCAKSDAQKALIGRILFMIENMPTERIIGEAMEETKLFPCPFCGGAAKIIICDDEGNIRDEEYKEHPYSGLAYMITHDIESNEDCPIARHADDGAQMGVWLYDTEEEAIEAWNCGLGGDDHVKT